MTRNQKACLDFVRAYIGERGVSPTLAEIAAALGFTARSAVHPILVQLKRDGKLTWTRSAHRSIRLLERPDVAFVGPSEAVRLAAAARKLLDALRYEDPATDEAVVSASLLGDLDIALAEAEAARLDEARA